MISVIIAFCDKDVECIPAMLEHLQCLSRSFEVVFVDDRHDKSSPADTGIYPCLSYEGNKGTFYARRYGFEHTKGDYVWFIDVDDKPFPFKLDGETADVLVYPYQVDNGKTIRLQEDKAEEYVADTYEKKVNASCNHLNGSMWNKLFKRELVEKAYSQLPYYEGLHIFEDCFLQAWMCSFSPSIKYVSKIIYRYNETKIYWFCENPNETQFLLENIPSELSKIWGKIVDDRNEYSRLNRDAV